jgi:4-amino-4-deoxy-L-arabinose transferase-like glycosyltransferase
MTGSGHVDGATGTLTPAPPPADTLPRTGSVPGGSWRRGIIPDVILLAGIAFALRLVQLDHAPHIDELYHALAARSLLEDGTLFINGTEPYTRAWAFTYLVAGLMAIFGDNLVVGRLPAVLAGVGLVVAVFLWLNAVAGRTAAWVAALLVCLAPTALYHSQQIRFYTVHALFLWVAAAAVYLAATGPRGRGHTAMLAAGAAACLAIAFHLQVSTLVSVAALATWLVLYRGGDIVRWAAAGGRRRTWTVVGATAAVVVVAAVFAAGGAAAEVVRMFSMVDVWAEGDRHYLRYYHDRFLHQYPTLWTLFPVAVLLAASRHPRPALFCVTMFTVPFVVHSFAAWKHERYLFYALPFFFAVWGLAAAVALPWLRGRIDAVIRHAPLPHRRAAGTLAAAALIAAVLFAAAGNSASMYTYRMLTVSDEDWTLSSAYRGEPVWDRALPVLQAEAADADVVMGFAMVTTLYYLHRLDMGLSATEVQRGTSTAEFSVAGKEGVPVVSRAESVRLVQACVPAGLVIGSVRGWRNAWGVPPETVDYIESSMERVPLPERWGLLAFRWRTSGAGREPACAALRSHREAAVAAARSTRAAHLTTRSGRDP